MSDKEKVEERIFRGRPSKQVTNTRDATEDEKQRTLTLEKKMGNQENIEKTKVNESKENNEPSIFSKILSKIDEMNSEMKKLRRENQETQEALKEVISLKQLINERESKWKEQKRSLEKRIRKLEKAEEHKKKEEKRNNMIIKGLEINSDVRKEVESFIKGSLDVEVEIKGTSQIGDPKKRSMIRVQLTNFEDKMRIRANKHKLKGQKIWIEDDLTKNELDIQREIAKTAKEEREKGNKIKIGCKKLCINSNKHIWKQDNEQEKGELFLEKTGRYEEK